MINITVHKPNIHLIMWCNFQKSTDWNISDIDGYILLGITPFLEIAYPVVCKYLSGLRKKKGCCEAGNTCDYSQLGLQCYIGHTDKGQIPAVTGK